MDERANRRATFVPYSEACCWRCPVPTCGLGLLANEASPKQRQTARLNHGKEAHPDLDQSLFHNHSNSAGNARKATIAKRNLGAARRIQRLADAAEAGHDPVWLAWPAAPPKGPRKRAAKNVLVHKVYCKTCKQTANQPGELAKKECQEGFEGPKRGKLVERLRAEVDAGTHNEELHAAAQRTLATLGADHEAAKRERAGAGEHHVDMWAWPGGTVRYVCNRCRFVASGAESFSKKCEGRVAVRRRTKEIESLREFASGKGAAHDQRAAKRILDYLGLDAHQKEDAGLAALAKGLQGTGVADGQP